jgi:hypothetical protein
MLPTNFKRLALALVTPAAGFGILVALSQATKAQAPANLRNVALQRAAKISGRSVSQLNVVNSAETQYRLQGKTVFDFKVMDEAGAIYGITLNSSGQEVSSAQLRTNEQAALAAQYGKLAPSLAQKLANAPAAQPIRVMIWLKESSQAGASRPTPNPNNGSRASAAQVNAFFEQVDTKRAAAVQPIVTPVSNKLKSLGSNVRTEKYSPVVYASLTPQAIRQVAAWNEVDQVYEERQVQPTLDIARQVITANVVNSRGFTGSGVKVAEIEVGGRINTSNPYLAGATQDTTFSCLSSHAAAVAGILRSTHPTVRGVAPAASLWVGGSCGGWPSELQNRSTAAADWGAQVFNLSLGGNFGVDGFARFYDDLVINRYRTVVVAAGNDGNTANVSSPATAYNVIAVGSFDDRNTLGWGDDVISSFSSGKDPSSTHGDREKPEVAAPGQNFNSTTNGSPWIGSVGSGTSYAAPMVAGTAALMIQRNSSLSSWPEAVKAILMTSAVKNVEGDSRLSELDGAGGVLADRADDVARGVGGSWGAQSYSCSAASLTDVATISLTAGQRTRATIVWDQNPNYSNYSSQPSADLDFQVVNSSNVVVASSASYDNTYEIVDFTPSTTGSYKLRVNKYRCDYDPRWLGWAWRQGN